MKLLVVLVGGVGVVVVGLVLMVVSVVAAMPWLGVDVPGGAGPARIVVPAPGQPVAAPVQVGAGMVSDLERYVLARAAGFAPLEAVTATAISIAEDGTGNPTALSAPNFDGSRDFCLWQVNSSWWPRFGGQQALADPQTCANAAHVVFTIQGWCAWSTFEAGCGKGHNGAYAAFMGRARTAASEGGGH